MSRDSPPWLKKENKGELPSLANQNARRGKPPSLLCGRKNLQHNKEEFPLPCHIETVSSDEEGGTSPCRVKKKRTSTQQGLQTLLATSTESCRAEKHHISRCNPFSTRQGEGGILLVASKKGCSVRRRGRHLLVMLKTDGGEMLNT